MITPRYPQTPHIPSIDLLQRRVSHTAAVPAHTRPAPIRAKSPTNEHGTKE
jgi:hypothetical protein